MKTAIVAAALALLGAAPAGAQGYRCDRANTIDELIVCDRGGLRALDRQLNTAYGRALSQADGRREAHTIRQDQREWLRDRRACGVSVGCIRAAYQNRIAELRRGVTYKD
jgi:uncharacterized protein